MLKTIKEKSVNTDHMVSNEAMVNERINTKQVRLVADNGDQIGVISTYEAMQRAVSEGMDLVVINDKVTPPIAKILNYGKFKYEQSTREKELAKKARASQVLVKEIQMRLVTDKNDIAIKARKTSGFLDDGNKVKVIIKFKGRELSHPDLGFALMQTFLGHIGSYKVEKESSMNGRDMVTILAPNKA